MSRVYIILVNWNGWYDTLECLESLLRLKYQNFSIVVVDNMSTDQSVNNIRGWADNKLDLISVGPTGFEALPSTSRSVRYQEYGEFDITKGIATKTADVLLIRASKNLGFAGGNNLGIRYVQLCGDADYVWLLNNDTFVPPESLGALISRLESKPDSGICGSTLLRYENPDQVQALGGAYYCRLLGLAWHLGQWRRLPHTINVQSVERKMSYVVGASMLVTREFLEQIGLMTEEYFLYFEEIDWVTRAQGCFSICYAPESLVYHKVGGAIGTRSHPGHKSMLCDYYSLRNRLLFSRRYFPRVLPMVKLGLYLELLVRLCLGKWNHASMVWSLLRSGEDFPPLENFQ